MTGTLWRLAAEGDATTLRAGYDRLSAREDQPALALSLFERGPDRAMLEALFDRAPDADAWLRTGGVDPAALQDVHVAPLPNEDWVALSLKGLPPVAAGRFFVHGSHDAPAGAVPILIEANLAFGTGHHGTTRGCLLAFDALLTGGETFHNVLDLGCGAGTLAIAAAKTTRATVTASDNDPVAIQVTLENMAANDAPHITTIVAEGLDDPRLTGAAPYDLVFANILAGPLIALSGNIAGVLTSGGRVILAGLLAEQRDAVMNAYEQAGLSLESEDQLDGWSVLVMRRS